MVHAGTPQIHRYVVDPQPTHRVDGDGPQANALPALIDDPPALLKKHDKLVEKWTVRRPQPGIRDAQPRNHLGYLTRRDGSRRAGDRQPARQQLHDEIHGGVTC